MSDPRILVCTPYTATTHPKLLAQWMTNADRLTRARPGLTPFLSCDASVPQIGDGRYSSHARARNALLDAIDLGAYDYLYWVDIDIVQWPEGLLDWAFADNPEGVSAPAVVLHRYTDRFYDTKGFREAGRDARLYPPWFDQDGPIIALESVGCCYIIPAVLYRDGARYRDTLGATEHLSIMRACRDQGRSVLANLELRAVHAYLPDYGEALH